jgi:type IV secretion system protein VirB4
MGFDLSEYSDKEFIVVPILYYMLYKIEDMLNGETPSIIVFKNSKQLLNNEIFTDKIVHLLDRLRLKNCVAIFSFDVEDYDNDVKKLLSLVSQKVSSKFILSDFNVNEELKDILKLDDNELRMINYFKDNKRKFLLKFGSNSMVANFDLSNNKPLTKILSSSFEDIAIVEEIFNHAKQGGKIIDNEIAIKQFYDVVETLEQEEDARKQGEERQANLVKMRRARGIE